MFRAIDPPEAEPLKIDCVVGVERGEGLRGERAQVTARIAEAALGDLTHIPDGHNLDILPEGGDVRL